MIIDMQNGFVDPKGKLYIGAAGRRILPVVQRVLEQALAKGSAMVFTADTHDPDDAEFAMWPVHCVRGTWESEIIPELRAFAEGARIQAKRRYSAFFDTDLDAYLQKINPDRVVVMGVCTDICVMHTVADLRNRDYEVIVIADGVASFDEAAHNFALQHMEKILGAQVENSTSILYEVENVCPA